ncbi:MAG: hypothetical protein SEPTF4163_002513 [Sporothrix epigloea]
MDWEPTRTVYAKKGNARTSAQKCLRCGRPGHVSPDCPAEKPAADRPARNGRPPAKSRNQPPSKSRVQKTLIEVVESEDEYVSAADEVAPVRSRAQELEPAMKDWQEKKGTMDQPSFYVNILINSLTFSHALVDTACGCYGSFSLRFADNARLLRIRLDEPRSLDGVVGETDNEIEEVAYVDIDVDGHIIPN